MKDKGTHFYYNLSILISIIAINIITNIRKNFDSLSINSYILYNSIIIQLLGK